MDAQNQIMGYDRAASMFSPDGHLLQVEYAEKTVRLGSASIALTCSDGVVIVADKRIRDELIIPESAQKIYEVDEHILATAAGILSDARVLLNKAQVLAQQNRVTYGTSIDIESVMREIADTKQIFTQYGGARPFGISMLIAGVDSKPRIFVSDVTGNYFGYTATAVGENDEKIKDMIREEHKATNNVEQGIKLALSIFRRILGKNFDINRFEIAYVTLKEKLITRLSLEEIKKYSK